MPQGHTFLRNFFETLLKRKDKVDNTMTRTTAETVLLSGPVFVQRKQWSCLKLRIWKQGTGWRCMLVTPELGRWMIKEFKAVSKTNRVRNKPKTNNKDRGGSSVDKTACLACRTP